MKEFMGEDFLLQTETARVLFHDHAASQPIYDYHCHLNPAEIAENRRFDNMAQIWLGGDHYKWRAMRTNGVSEDLCTGSADDFSKYMAWAETVPQCIGNPLYHWTHQELRRPFGIKEIFNPASAGKIWNTCNEMLHQEDFSVQGIIKQMNVKLICTTDDPVDDLASHNLIRTSDFETKVYPAWRPDKGINIHKADVFIPWIKKLSETSGINADSLTHLKEAFITRLDHFHSKGCRLSDHGLDAPVFEEAPESQIEKIYQKGLKGELLSQKEIQQYQTHILAFLGREYHKRNWIMQLHMGALRSNNSRMLKALGPDTGFDSIADNEIALPLSQFMNSLEKNDELPKTILYCLNPRDNYVLATMAGNFQGGGVPGKIQFGSGWWFCDQKEGMEQQMSALSHLGLLSRFVGMLTDSRSFLSYTRHEYFRRILCNMLGNWVEGGEFPRDEKLLGQIVENICYNNAANYFGMEL